MLFVLNRLNILRSNKFNEKSTEEDQRQLSGSCSQEAPVAHSRTSTSSCQSSSPCNSKIIPPTRSNTKTPASPHSNTQRVSSNTHLALNYFEPETPQESRGPTPLRLISHQGRLQSTHTSHLSGDQANPTLYLLVSLPTP